VFGSQQSPANGCAGCMAALAGWGQIRGDPAPCDNASSHALCWRGWGGFDGWRKKTPKMQRAAKAGSLSPLQGLLAMGGDASFPRSSSCSSLPFPHTGSASPRCVQVAAPLPPLAAMSLEAGFAISPSFNVNIVSVGCPNQKNSLKGPQPVLLWISTKVLFCQVLPTPCLPVLHPASLPMEVVSTGKEPKPRRRSLKGSSSPQSSF